MLCLNDSSSSSIRGALAGEGGVTAAPWMTSIQYSQALGDGVIGFYRKANLKWGTTNFYQVSRRGDVNASVQEPEAGIRSKPGPPSVRSQHPAPGDTCHIDLWS